jgi:hypothetical protein
MATIYLSDRMIAVDDSTLKPLFNQNYYIANLPASVAEALALSIANGAYKDAFDHWTKVGIKMGYAPNKFYNETAYLNANTDLRPFVKGQEINPDLNKVFLNSALEHWILWGRKEGIDGVNATRATSYTPMSYSFTSGVDNLVADSGMASTFTGTDSTIQSGDVADGGSKATSTLNITASGGNINAATIKNFGNVNITASGGGRTFTATNTTAVDAINTSASTSDVTVSSLGINPKIGMVNTGQNMTVTFLDSVLSGNTGAASVALSNVTAGVLTMNRTAAGYFKTLGIASSGSSNVLSANGLTGSALVGTDTLNITGSASLTLPVKNDVNTIRTVTAAPVTNLSFADTATGATGGALTATFNSAGSRLDLSGNTVSSSNKITFTGAGNTLGLNQTAANSVSSSIASTFTNLDTLAITDGVNSTTVACANFGSGIKNVILEADSAAASSITGLAAGGKITVGKGNALAQIDQAVTVNFASGNANTLTIDLVGNGASKNEKFTTTNTEKLVINPASSINSGTQTFTIAAASGDIYLKNIEVKGGNAGATVSLAGGTLPASVNSIDASASLSKITATANNNVAMTIKGSSTAASTLTGGTANDIIIGGAGDDILDGMRGINSLTGGAGSDTFKFTDFDNVTTITDFNPGTSTTTVDKIQISVDPADRGYAFNAVVTGAGNAAPATAVVPTANAKTISSMTATTLNSDDRILLYTGTATTASDLQTAVRTGGNMILTFTNDVVANAGIPIVYLHTDGNVHIAGIRCTTAAGGNNTTAEITAAVQDIAILQGVTSMANINSTDFEFIA